MSRDCAGRPVHPAPTAVSAPAAAVAPPAKSRGRGTCRNNAPMARFFHTPKVECVHHRVCTTRNQARREWFGQIAGRCHVPPQSTRYVVGRKRFCCRCCGPLAYRRPALGRLARLRTASVSGSARAKARGLSGNGWRASVSPRSAASRCSAGAPPRASAGVRAGVADRHAGAVMGAGTAMGRVVDERAQRRMTGPPFTRAGSSSPFSRKSAAPDARLPNAAILSIARPLVSCTRRSGSCSSRPWPFTKSTGAATGSSPRRAFASRADMARMAGRTCPPDRGKISSGSGQESEGDGEAGCGGGAVLGGSPGWSHRHRRPAPDREIGRRDITYRRSGWPHPSRPGRIARERTFHAVHPNRPRRA